MDISYATPVSLDSPVHVAIAEELGYERPTCEGLERFMEAARGTWLVYGRVSSSQFGRAGGGRWG